MYEKEHENYIHAIEQELFERHLSLKEMARLLYISESTLKNLIYRRSTHIELSLILRMYELNGKMLYLLTGSKIPHEVIMSQHYKMLRPDHQLAVDSVIMAFLELEKGRSYEL